MYLFPISSAFHDGDHASPPQLNEYGLHGVVALPVGQAR